MCLVVYIFLTFTQGDIGSPLTKLIDMSVHNYIIGVTIRETMGITGTLLSFIRINPVLGTIRRLVEELQK